MATFPKIDWFGVVVPGKAETRLTIFINIERTYSPCQT